MIIPSKIEEHPGWKRSCSSQRVIPLTIPVSGGRRGRGSYSPNIIAPLIGRNDAHFISSHVPFHLSVNIYNLLLIAFFGRGKGSWG